MAGLDLLPALIDLGAVLLQGEFIGEGLAGLDMGLRKPADAIHSAGQQDAVPVHAGVFRQPVGDK